MIGELRMVQRKSTRRRGVILSRTGLARLRKAIEHSEVCDRDGKRYTLEDLNLRVGLDPKTIAKIFDRQIGLDKRTLDRIFRGFGLELTEEDYTRPAKATTDKATQIDWGEAVDISAFYGRQTELQTLNQWVLGDRCRTVALLGMGGAGKTALSVKLAQQLQGHFDCILWRSLRNAPPLTDVLADIFGFLVPENLPTGNLGRQITQLLEYLSSCRCLLVLDNWETLLGSTQNVAGLPRAGYEGYAELLRQVGEVCHQSCLILTSREKPAEIAALEGDTLPVRTFPLPGLGAEDAVRLLEVKGLAGDTNEYKKLVEFYQGNPLGLKMVATAIRDIFAGDVGAFLGEGIAVCNGLRILLEQQFQRLSPSERELMYWLATVREPISLGQLRSHLVFPIASPKLLEALESLRRRSLCVSVREPASPTSSPRFTLQPVVMEFVTGKLIDGACTELITGNPPPSGLLWHHTLLEAQTKDYIRATQRQLILQPLVDELLAQFHTPEAIEAQLRDILQNLRRQHPHEPGYLVGNLLNLLCHLQADLTDCDFSNLVIWQADLQYTPLQGTNFTNADLSKSELAKAYSVIATVAFSPNGKFLATGHFVGHILLWDVTQTRLVRVFEGHQNNVWSIAFTPDGRYLASGSEDGSVRLWDVVTGQCDRVFATDGVCIRSIVISPQGDRLFAAGDDGRIWVWELDTGNDIRIWTAHPDPIWDIAISPNGKILASVSDDRTAKLWDTATGRCIRTFSGHTDWLRAVEFSPDGELLATAGCDERIRIWQANTGRCIREIYPHTHAIFALAFLNGGQQLASGSSDRTICITQVSTGDRIATLRGHTSTIYGLAVNPGETHFASGGDDPTIRLWDLRTKTCQKTIQAQMSWIASVAFSPDGETLVTGSADGAIRFWQVATGTSRTSWGHRGTIYSVAFSLDGKTLASGGCDLSVRLWDVQTGRCRQIWQGHTATVTAVAFHPNGKILASGSWDGTVRLWDLATGTVLDTLSGHFIQSIAFSLDGTKLAVGAFDASVSLWDLETKQCQTFRGHTQWTWYVALSPDGKILASGSVDGTVRLWDISTGQCLQVLEGHEDWVMAIAFSPDGQILASPSKDGTVRLWDVTTGKCLQVLQGHQMWVTSVAFSPDRRVLVSGSGELTVKFWTLPDGKCDRTWKAPRIYEGMQISGVRGLSVPQQEMLKFLGAVS